jgi:hypothetical protein
MKIIVRSFVVALALTGAIATTATSAKATVTSAKTSAAPAPRCPLNTPDGCGLGNW